MNVIDTIRDATRASVTTMGSARIYAPLSPGSSASGRNATMLIIVPKRIACRSRNGPNQAAIPRGWPWAIVSVHHGHGEQQVHLFVHVPDLAHAADAGDLLEFVLQHLGGLFQLTIAGARDRAGSHRGQRVLVPHQDDRWPAVGMRFILRTNERTRETADEPS